MIKFLQKIEKDYNYDKRKINKITVFVSGALEISTFLSTAFCSRFHNIFGLNFSIFSVLRKSNKLVMVMCKVITREVILIPFPVLLKA